MKTKKRHRTGKLKPSMYKLQSELRELMKTDETAVLNRLIELAETDPKSADKIGENIGIFMPEADVVSLGNGVFCTANAIGWQA